MGITVGVKQGQNRWDVAVASEPGETTVAQFKELVAGVAGVPVENQRLIYSGKILKDAQTLEEYKITDGHTVHLVKSGGAKSAGSSSSSSEATTAAGTAGTAPAAGASMAAGQQPGFNPLADLTSARYAGYNLPMPSADMFGPDGGLTSGGGPGGPQSQEEILSMLENPIFQSQMNEMFSNPQMVDFLIQSNPQLQAMGPQAREMLQSPMFRQMLTNPDMVRQSMQFSQMMQGSGAGAGGADPNAFPAPGGDDTGAPTNTSTNASAAGPAGANPFSSLFGGAPAPAAQPFQSAPGFDAAAFMQAMSRNGATAPAAAPQDTRPPEERYEQQLRQLNDMGFSDFDRNVAALRRAGGSLQGALDALLNGDV
ncbi:ubiquitin domain-containing protein DSK2 KNAG_0J00290 [Huiozyma naganishii CBS 8797]|uniref:Ubiquitin-like domain-containing protein n=1 Tax=Huiozyma naganishii (strain ATCC MYA-139 / BCRC 22969 / CBS 8797 / KCTC 17520 / NBRC 10181 / NCYC 3082 / Yp74L-3) TaxID=1071383 RepID=J7S2M2_HUIN7|nr:hypothetical protein KNAG_0J00290 [Kazachstania naganishii CBS 8797]CCK72112.1 hypothetical protein KNAG_0J00290 [Kazachstania naganishii CBS 8797]